MYHRDVYTLFGMTLAGPGYHCTSRRRLQTVITGIPTSDPFIGTNNGMSVMAS
jgi:hypothetical protein